jgi:glucose-1-phosphate thymidylyltransferase
MLKGIVLAGGSGTRLYPITRGVSKQLLPVYDKPMIYYPLSTLMLAGIRDILVITTPEDRCQFERLLGDGQQWGIRLRFAEQPKPAGLAEAFIIGADFIGSHRVAMVLGDNIFFGHGLPDMLAAAAERKSGATVFAYHVRDPERYGVVTFDKNERPVSIEEKPKRPRSNWAITGLYFFDNDVVRYASAVKPSTRGELEITDLQMRYLTAGRLHVERMGRGFAWLDTGTFESLIDAAGFVQTLERRQGMKVACLEEIAFRQGFIDREQILGLAKSLQKSGYGEYLVGVVDSAEAERPARFARSRGKKVSAGDRHRTDQPALLAGRL